MIGLDNLSGSRPALVAEDVERLLRAMAGRPAKLGVDKGTKGIADAFGVSVKTLYRYWPGRVEWRSVDGYRIPFLCRPGYRPVVLDTRDGPAGFLAAKLP